MSEFAQVSRAGPRGMITLRADLSAAKVKAAVKAATGAAMPEVRRIVTGKDGAVAWMSPDELLVMVDHGAVDTTLAALRKALDGVHHLAVDVSEARACFVIEGPGCREVVAKLCPVDMDPSAFGPGELRRTRMGQVAAAFWMPQEGRVDLVCFRSVADYALDLLTVSAEAGPVGHF